MRLVGQEQQDVVDRGSIADGGVVPLRQLPHPAPDVAEERLPVRLALGLRAGLQVAQVGRQRELDVHVEDVALRHGERVVGQGASALHRRLLLVVDVLDEPGQAEHVLGHALAPLAPGLGVGQRLPQALRAGREGLGDLGLGAQRLVHLAELLGVALAQLPDEVPEPLHLRPQLGLHLVQPGVDHVLLGRERVLAGGEVGAQLLLLAQAGLVHELAVVGGDLLQLLALQHGRLLQRGLDGGVALGHRLLLHRGDGGDHRCRDRARELRLVHPARRRRRPPQHDERAQQPETGAEHQRHEREAAAHAGAPARGAVDDAMPAMFARRCYTERGCPALRGRGAGSCCSWPGPGS